MPSVSHKRGGRFRPSNLVSSVHERLGLVGITAAAEGLKSQTTVLRMQVFKNCVR